jgi:electron transfer flavoprotein alpha subunit
MQNKLTLIIAEHVEGKLKPVTYELLACANVIQQFQKTRVHVVLLGDDIEALANHLAENYGCDVIAVGSPYLKSYNGEVYKTILTQLVQEMQPALVCIAHSAQGLDFAPAIAFRADAACITGVERIFRNADGLCFSRSILGGKVVADVCPTIPRAIVTVQPGFFKPLSPDAVSPGKVELRSTPLKPLQSHSVGIKTAHTSSDSLLEAKVVITSGRGIGKKENLALIYRLAKLFPKSAVGGSRPVCDMGWLEYRQQVGVTGATVTPELYVACGVSGAVQHVSGMRGAECVVAINTDPNAAIFNVADVCIVEDLNTFIPALIAAWEKQKGSPQRR